jgi:septum formation protein
LASTSVYRRELLARLKIPFTCHSPGVDETALPGEEPMGLIARLAHAKAQAVASRYPEAWVIGSDQVAVLREGAEFNSVLGKPGSVANCLDQLRRCSGKTLAFVTAVAIVRHVDGASHQFIDMTRVTFRALDTATIERYVEREAPLDCAGGFKSEGLGITLCEAIECTDPTGLIGLPLLRLCEVLRGVGYTLP